MTHTYTPEQWVKAFGLISPIGLTFRDDRMITGILGSDWFISLTPLPIGYAPTIKYGKVSIFTATLVDHLLTALEGFSFCGKPNQVTVIGNTVYFSEGDKMEHGTPVWACFIPALATIIGQDTYTKTSNGWGRG